MTANYFEASIKYIKVNKDGREHSYSSGMSNKYPQNELLRLLDKIHYSDTHREKMEELFGCVS